MGTPWFKLYPADYLLDGKVDALPLEAQGILVRLWCLCAKDGSIPDDPGTLARRGGVAEKTMRRHWDALRAFFCAGECGLYSSRLSREVAAYEEKCQKLRQNASRGGKVRGKHLLEQMPKQMLEQNASNPAKHLLEQNPAESESEKEKDYPPTPQGGPVVAVGVLEVPKRKRRSVAERLSPYQPEVVAMVRRLMPLWPTQRADGSSLANDPVDAASAVERILGEHPDVRLVELEAGAREWLAESVSYPNAIQFWFGPGKRGGPEPPWRRAVRALRTRAELLPLETP